MSLTEIFYHGSSEDFSTIASPSPAKPFFVADNPKYALSYSNGHTLQEDDWTGFVYAITLNYDNLKIFDMSDSEYLSQLSISKFIQNMFSHYKIPIKIVRALCETIHNLQMEYSNVYKITKNNIDSFVRKNIQKIKYLWCGNKGPAIDNLPLLMSNLPLESFSYLIMEIINLFQSKNILLSEISQIPDNPFSNRKLLYSIFAKLIINEIAAKKFTAIKTNEGSAKLNVYNVNCIGIIDKIALDKISVKKYTAQEIATKVFNT